MLAAEQQRDREREARIKALEEEKSSLETTIATPGMGLYKTTQAKTRLQTVDRILDTLKAHAAVPA